MNNNIDVVYTWVDSSDINWIRLKEKYWNELCFGDNSPKRFPMTSNPCAELHLSLESLIKYAPWVNNIFVITMRPQIPNLPNYLMNKIKIIHHDEIWKNKNNLPVFNSHAIEANIHRIPNLSEKFIYMNDDLYFSSEVKSNNFFDKNGHCIVNGTEKRIHKSIKTPYSFSHNNLYLMEKEYYFRPWHHAVPLTKTLMTLSEKYFGEIWENTSKNKFRSNNDIPPITASIIYGNKKNIIIKNMSELKFLSDTSLQSFLKKDTNIKYNCICINNCRDFDIYAKDFKNYLFSKKKNSLNLKYLSWIQKKSQKRKQKKKSFPKRIQKQKRIQMQKQKRIQKQKKIQMQKQKKQKQLQKKQQQKQKRIQKQSNSTDTPNNNICDIKNVIQLKQQKTHLENFWQNLKQKNYEISKRINYFKTQRDNNKIEILKKEQNDKQKQQVEINEKINNIKNQICVLSKNNTKRVR
jgi:hypothetical protein